MMRSTLAMLLVLGVGLIVGVGLDRATAAATTHPDYARPPIGAWGVSWCQNRGVIWVHDANLRWWRFSSEDGTGPDLNDNKSIQFFNEWIQSAAGTDVIPLTHIVCS